jgi:CheY-like chemotaxis protein
MARGTVLCIEDDPGSLRLIEMIFERSGIELITATQGREGLAVARERRPDVILLDLHLQDMEGEDVLHAIRADPSLQRTAVVVVTAEQYPRLPERMRAAGAQAYLMKPIDVKQLLAVIEGHLI